MASLSLSSSTVGMLADYKPVHAAVLHAVDQHTPANLPPPLVNIVVDYLNVRRELTDGIFGEADWTSLFGRVPRAPALPVDFERIWQGTCPIFGEKRLCETHMLVYLPATVNGDLLTFNSFNELVKKHYPDIENPPGIGRGAPRMQSVYRYIWQPIIEKIGDSCIGDSRWVLMANEGLPGSFGTRFHQREALVASLTIRAGVTYEVPNLLDAVVCIVSRFVKTKLQLFAKDGWSEHYNISCRGTPNLGNLTIGEFRGKEGLFLSHDNYDYNHPSLCVAPLRRLRFRG